jgi:hypothetical protein
VIRVCEDAVLVVPTPTCQRHKTSGAFYYVEGTCDPAAMVGRGKHLPHPVPLTAVQTILVADPEFVAAWARCA